MLESSEQWFNIKDRCLLIFLIISECVLTISSSCRAELTSMFCLKRGMSVPSCSPCSPCQTLSVINGSAALTVEPITAPPAADGLCCLCQCSHSWILTSLQQAGLIPAFRECIPIAIHWLKCRKEKDHVFKSKDVLSQCLKKYRSQKTQYSKLDNKMVELPCRNIACKKPSESRE